MQMLYTTFDSPIGELLLAGDGQSLHHLHMQEGKTRIDVRDGWEEAAEPFDAVREQLNDYFAGRRTRFDVPLTMTGSAFQRRVWSELRKIPYGESISYGELAQRIGIPSAARAVGTANGLNPVAVIVPCHRVIGADGSLTGFGGGLERKRFLLDLEAGALTLDNSLASLALLNTTT
jgi:methylated-DNA-[protein]-cysteine S-methyltransferase